MLQKFTKFIHIFELFLANFVIILEFSIGENWMKKIFLCCLLALSVCTASYSACPHGCSHQGHHNHAHSTCHGHHPSSSSSSEHVYVVSRDYSKTEQKFPNCTKHYMIVETVTYHYSDGSRRSFSNCTVYNSDGSVIVAGCSSAKHILFENKHYFIICKNGCYLMDSEGNKLTKRTYSRMEEFKPNRFIVKYDKKYGIIDIKENVIVPIKYQKFITEGNGIFVTKLNGYWGIVDSENNVLVNNDCDKIKSIHDTIMIKRYHKYGLSDLDGKIILDIKYDKIKKLGEYIVVKEGKKYFVINYDGERINDFTYKKIKLERNTIFGLGDDGAWVKIK